MKYNIEVHQTPYTGSVTYENGGSATFRGRTCSRV